MKSGTSPTNAKKNKFVGANASPKSNPDNAGKKSSLLQLLLGEGAVCVDPVAGMAVESGFVTR
jgi:hypothetical protein